MKHQSVLKNLIERLRKPGRDHSIRVHRTYLGIGSWWHGEHEVDVVGLGDDGTLVAGECKHTSNPMTIGDFEGLQRSAREIRRSPPRR